MTRNRVEELQNFPFPDFRAFRGAYARQEVESGIDRSYATQLAANSRWTPTGKQTQIKLLLLGPSLIWLGTLAYALATRRWLLAAGIPAVALGWFFLSPSARHIFPVLRYGVWVVGLVWGVASSNSGIAILSGGLLAALRMDDLRTEMALDEIHRQASHIEEALCALWNAGILSIRFTNGDRYWKEWKVIDGKHIEHES